MTESLPPKEGQAKIIIYTKDYCPYCTAAKNLLTQKGFAYEEIDLVKSPEKRDEMLKISDGRTTVPQIFINDKGIGGFDDMKALEDKGELDSLLMPT